MATRLRPWMMLYTALAHVGAICALFVLKDCDNRTLYFATALYVLSGFGVTAGAHRLWSHRSYTAKLPFRVFLMIANSIANQGTIWHWVRDHRVHHKFSETDADPHNATRGFWFAHIGWLLCEKDPQVVRAGRDIDLSDLKADPVVAFQKRAGLLWNVGWCFLAPTLVASVGWNERTLHALLVPGFLRYVFLLHCTWLVNSAAHMYGDRPYSAINPAENSLVATLAFGEGWHNWHHTYPFDYAASELGVLGQYNPTKALIDAAAFCGLVTRRRRATDMWARKQQKQA